MIKCISITLLTILWQVIAFDSICQVTKRAGTKNQTLIIPVSKLNRYMQERARISNFSGTVLIAKDGKILFEQAYGVANHDFKIPCTINTKFRIGSITKMFTAAAILLLEQKGILNTGDHVNKYLTDWPEKWSEVTIYNLITHTAGLPKFSYPTAMMDISGLIWTNPNPPKSIKDLCKEGEDAQALDFKPGEKFAYSNFGYIILGLIIEKLSGKSYDDFLTESIFKPLNMNNSGCESPNEILENKANGYVWSSDKFSNASYVDARFNGGAGSIYSTIEDIMKFNIALHSGSLLNQAQQEKCFEPFLSDYAYGWWIQKTNNKSIHWHRGTVSGFVGYNSYYPEEKFSVIVLSNVNRMPVKAIGRELASISFDESYELPAVHKELHLDTLKYDYILGKYCKADNPSDCFEIIKDNNQMYIKGIDNSYRFEIFPESIDKFFAKWGEYYLDFKQVKEGKIMIRNDGEASSWRKIL